MSQKRYAVIGHPIGHTMSPFIHQRLFESKGIDASYGVCDIPAESLTERIQELKTLDGFNITIPHKQAILPFLERLGPKAAFYQSVNTVKNDGSLQGYNTDAEGFLLALRQAGIPLKGRVVILGAGGVARTMAYEAVMAGCFVTLAVRRQTLLRAAALSGSIRNDLHSGDTNTCRIDALRGPIDLLINATPVGMHPHREDCPVSREILESTRYVFDAVYNPLETRLVKTARECGCQALGGLSMLVWQAAAAHRIWDGSQYTDQEISALCRETERELLRLFPEPTP